jgi:hypothetical protein
MNPPVATSRPSASASGTSAESTPRFGFWNSAAKIDDSIPPLFVVEAGTGPATCENGPAYRDVRYVRVTRENAANTDGSLSELLTRPVRPTIAYSPAVAGTDLIYDVTGEFLQGKARPFACDLSREAERIYAVLPFQLEIIAAVAEQRTEPPALLVRVEFQQASGERIVGMLPFEMQLLAARGHVAHASWRATDAAGLFSASLPLPENIADCRWKLVVRSQLDGQTERVEI